MYFLKNVLSSENTGGVDDAAEGSVKTQLDLHIVILTLSFNIFQRN